jgi:hypothetical protein
MDVRLPDGTVIKNVPDGTTKAQLVEKLRNNGMEVPAEWGAPQSAAAPQPAAEKQSDFARLIGNIPGSAKNFAGGIVNAVTSPLETLKGAALAGEGAARAILPDAVSQFVDKRLSGNPEVGARADATAGALGQFYKDRYGSLGQAKESLITDPVGVVSDVSTVLGVGGAMAPGKVGQALNTASKFTNPLSVVPAAAKVTGKAGQQLLGLSTGVGPENIAQAAKAGVRGDTAFWKNLTGQSDMTEVLAQAKAGLDQMRQAKSAQYRSDMTALKTDKAVLKFDGIDNALADAGSLVSFKGQTKNPRAAAAVQQMADDVQQWKQLDPAEFHTPEGLDALKQKLGATLESIPFEEKTARLAAGKVYNSVKAEIESQAPTYAKTMRDYTQASEQISEIERAFSLGNRASQDTAMRKLQSLSRNNVNTNYGNRLDLAKKLVNQGGQDVFPAIAGQAMNTWTGRGLVGHGGSLATLGGAAALQNPALVGLLPFQSPKAVGAALYGTGRAAGASSRLLGLDKLDPDAVRLLGLLSSQLGQERPQPDW